MPGPFLKTVKLKRGQVPSFEEYPFSIPAIRHLDELELRSAVTFFIGENGTGKSTLLEAIAIAMGFNAEGGSRNFRFSTRASHSSLHEYLGLVRSGARPRDGYFLRAESFYNVATAADEYGVAGGYGGESLHAQSHGESFMALVLNRLKGKGRPFSWGIPAEILQFGPDAISPIDYKATEHYVVTRAFLEQPERMLQQLMGPDSNQ